MRPPLDATYPWNSWKLSKISLGNFRQYPSQQQRFVLPKRWADAALSRQLSSRQRQHLTKEYCAILQLRWCHCCWAYLPTIGRDHHFICHVYRGLLAHRDHQVFPHWDSCDKCVPFDHIHSRWRQHLDPGRTLAPLGRVHYSHCCYIRTSSSTSYQNVHLALGHPARAETQKYRGAGYTRHDVHHVLRPSMCRHAGSARLAVACYHLSPERTWSLDLYAPPKLSCLLDMMGVGATLASSRPLSDHEDTSVMPFRHQQVCPAHTEDDEIAWYTIIH